MHCFLNSPQMAADWHETVWCKRTAAYPLLVICRWSWHMWWKSLYKYMRLETLGERCHVENSWDTHPAITNVFPSHPSWMYVLRLENGGEFVHTSPHLPLPLPPWGFVYWVDCCWAWWSLGGQSYLPPSRNIKIQSQPSGLLIFHPQCGLQVSCWRYVIVLTWYIWTEFGEPSVWLLF